MSYCLTSCHKTVLVLSPHHTGTPFWNLFSWISPRHSPEPVWERAVGLRLKDLVVPVTDTFATSLFNTWEVVDVIVVTRPFSHLKLYSRWNPFREYNRVKVCSHLTFAFASVSTSPSEVNIASIVTQTKMQRMGLNPFCTSALTWW